MYHLTLTLSWEERGNANTRENYSNAKVSDIYIILA
jgi:hypothetical protein